MPPVLFRHFPTRFRTETFFGSLLFGAAGLREDAVAGGGVGDGWRCAAASSLASRGGARLGAAAFAFFACSPTIKGFALNFCCLPLWPECRLIDPVLRLPQPGSLKPMRPSCAAVVASKRVRRTQRESVSASVVHATCRAMPQGPRSAPRALDGDREDV